MFTLKILRKTIFLVFPKQVLAVSGHL